MNFIKNLIRKNNLIWELSKNDYKNKFSSTNLGGLWGILSPFVFMITYTIVFQYILKIKNIENIPYIVWFLPGFSMWNFINTSIINATNSIREYSYLVKKIVFPIDIIPVISITSSFIIGLFLFLFSTIVCIIFGYIPNIVSLLYILICAYCFIISITRLTSALATIAFDFSKLLEIFMQLLFWFTPIVWDISIVSNSYIIKCMPFTYLVAGFRQSFTGGNIITQNNGIYSIIFWIITISLFLLGNYVFEKNKKEFPDIL